MARISRRTKWLRISLNALEISQPDSSGAGCPASSGSIEKNRLPDLPYRKMACDRKSIAERMDINIAGNHIGHPKSYFSPYGMEIWKNGPEGEFLMIGYFFRVGCFWHKNFLILCYSWWMIWDGRIRPYLFGSKRRIIMRYMRPRTWSDWRKGA